MIVYNDWLKYWQYWDNENIDTIMNFSPSSENCIILIHGYANSTEDVRPNYLHIEKQIKSAINDVDIIGFHWKSKGKIFKYYTDLVTAKNTGITLNKIITILREKYNYRRVSILAHSMGCFMLMKALQNHIVFYQINKIVLMGGDCLKNRFKSGNTFGTRCSAKIKALCSYYSPHDTVLRLPAILARPGARIGAHELPENHPQNYCDDDANLFSLNKVRHNDYKNMKELLQIAAKFLIE